MVEPGVGERGRVGTPLEGELSRLRWLVSLVALNLYVVAAAVEWTPDLANTPGLHTTTLEVEARIEGPLPSALVIDLRTLDEGLWRCRWPLDGGATIALHLAARDFQPIRRGNAGQDLHFSHVVAASITRDGSSDEGLAGVSLRWSGDDGVRYPWESDPVPVRIDGGSWWPGLHRNNAGHFGWRWEPNGLLINNVNFDQIERSWYYFKPGREPNETFRFRFGVPAATLAGKPADETAEADEPRNALAQDAIEADWTTLRWRRRLTLDDREHFQELRYSAMAVGVQVETDAPVFAVSFTDREEPRAPAGIVVPGVDGPTVLPDVQAVDPQAMQANWLVLLSADGSPEIPVMLVFERRPDALEIGDGHMLIRRDAGVGTVAIGTPFGVYPQAVDLLQQWSADADAVPRERLALFAELLAAYPWLCSEHFRVEDGWVSIRNELGFLPWADDWGTVPQPRTPLPPLVAYSVERGYLPRACVAAHADTGIPTKWGPLWVQPGSVAEYRLPVPEAWDFAPLGVSVWSEQPTAMAIIERSLADEQLERLHIERPRPSIYPHCNTHDLAAGVWRAANFLSPGQRDTVRQDTHVRVQSGLFPQNYLLRRDPVTGASYLACSFVWGSPVPPNDDGHADVDYWQGLVLYGLYTQAKYAGDWGLMRAHWPLIRSLASYWEATSSWALMGPGAREAGEIYGGDMATAGYAGLVGFHRLCERLGTPYQRDLAEYLLAKNAVPMAAKLSFLDHALAMMHQEARRAQMPSTGFGERWVASFPGVRPELRDHGSGDIWWRTGCLGPQSVQSEVMDLYTQRCPEDLRRFEAAFVGRCPNEVLATHDETRVPPHIAARAWMGGEMLASARDLMERWRRWYLLRDAHVAAMMAAWDVPVRLVDWAPAYVEQARWDARRREARITIDVSERGCTFRWAASAEVAAVTVDGRDAAFMVAQQREEWALCSLDLPGGRHQVRIEVGSPGH